MYRRGAGGWGGGGGTHRRAPYMARCPAAAAAAPPPPPLGSGPGCCVKQSEPRAAAAAAAAAARVTFSFRDARWSGARPEPDWRAFRGPNEPERSHISPHCPSRRSEVARRSEWALISHGLGTSILNSEQLSRDCLYDISGC